MGLYERSRAIGQGFAVANVINYMERNRADAVLAGESEPVGYPCEDVFTYDKGLLDELRWVAEGGGDRSLATIWQQARAVEI